MGTQLKVILVIVGVLVAAGATGLGLYYGTREDATEQAAGTGSEQAAVTPAPEASAPASAPADEEQAAGPVAPSFDLVRVEPTGELVAAGRAAVGARVALMLGDESIAEAEANESGEWALVADEPLPPGSYDLLLRATSPEGDGIDGDRVTIVIEAPDRTPLVAVAPPGAPTRVLQQPQAPAAVAEAPSPGGTQPPASPSAGSAPTGEQQVAAAPAATAQEQGNSAPSQQGAQPAPAAEAPGTGAQPPAPAANEVASAPGSAPADAGAPASGTTAAGTAAAEEEIPEGNVSIETVEVEEPGRLMLGGRAEPGDAVRLYLNNEQLADVETGADGRWTLSTDRPMPPGRYELRADVVATGSGQVTARAQVRFDRVQLVAAGSPAAAGQTADAGSGVTIVSRGAGAGGAQSGAIGAGAGTSVVVIARGDSLWQIARKIYGQGVRHTVIYDANRNQIGNPNLIYPGQVFTIPVLEDDEKPKG